MEQMSIICLLIRETWELMIGLQFHPFEYDLNLYSIKECRILPSSKTNVQSHFPRRALFIKEILPMPRPTTYFGLDTTSHLIR